MNYWICLFLIDGEQFTCRNKWSTLMFSKKMQKILNKLTIALHVNPALEQFYFSCHSSSPRTTFDNFLNRHRKNWTWMAKLTPRVRVILSKCQMKLKYFHDPILEKKTLKLFRAQSNLQTTARRYLKSIELILTKMPWR